MPLVVAPDAVAGPCARGSLQLLVRAPGWCVGRRPLYRPPTQTGVTGGHQWVCTICLVVASVTTLTFFLFCILLVPAFVFWAGLISSFLRLLFRWHQIRSWEGRAGPVGRPPRFHRGSGPVRRGWPCLPRGAVRRLRGVAGLSSLRRRGGRAEVRSRSRRSWVGLDLHVPIVWQRGDPSHGCAGQRDRLAVVSGRRAAPARQRVVEASVGADGGGG